MPSRALAHVPPPPPSIRLLRAEGRVRALLDEVLRLDAEREALERELATFTAEWQRATGSVLAELDAAERVVRRLRRIEDEILRLESAPPEPRSRRGARQPATAARRTFAGAAARGAAEEHGDDGGVVEPEELALKRLHRRLARAIHPDLARGDAERAQYAEWMARVNGAYHRRDLAALEILADRIGLGAAPGEPTERDRLARLERRAIALQGARDSLGSDVARLRASEAFRTRRRAAERAAAGGDLAGETRDAAAARLVAAREEALRRYDGCAARTGAFQPVAGRGRARTTSQLARSPLARQASTLAEVTRPSARGLELARELEEASRGPEPWEAALTLLAFFCEVAGRVPDAIAAAAGLSGRWDALRAAWPNAPELPRALARLPRHLEIGLRYRGPALAAGVQLTSSEALAGVRHALASGALHGLAREVLAACGPREGCDACGAAVFAIHLLRTRGLDEVHGLACPRCGSVLRSFVRYGAADGMEALLPLALEVGLVSEVHVAIGRRVVAFQMVPALRATLTADRLARLVHGLYVEPHALPLQLRHLAFDADGQGRILAPSARVPADRPVRLRLSGAAMRERDVAAWVKDRIERRFRG